MEKQNRKRELVFILIIFGILLNLLVISAPLSSFGGAIPSSFSGDNYRVWGASINPQFTQPGFFGGSGIVNIRDYWSSFNREDCKERQDVILMIPPGGCSPAVVRSDLLEERNVPVFCKVTSIQVNPLIDVSKIRSIHFKGQFPRGISGVSYYPARAAVRSVRSLEASPIIDNVGYLVVTLARQEVESEMPDWLGGNVTAVIDYDAEGVLGVGEHDFYLNEMDDDEWERRYKEFGFWKGKGFIRLDSVDVDSARISIYRDGTFREATVNLKRGETSGDVYLDGYYCAAGMNIKLEDVDYPVDTALLTVDDEEIWVSKGSRFLDGKCRVSRLDVFDVGGGRVGLKCSGVRGTIDLMFGGAEVNLKVDNEDKKISSGHLVKTSGGKNIYVAYVGKVPNENGNFVVLVKTSDDEDVFASKKVGALAHRVTDRYSKNRGWLQGLKEASSRIYNLWDQTRTLFDKEKDRRWLAGEKGTFYSYLIYEINDRYGIGAENIWVLKTNHNTWEKEKISFEGVVLEEGVLEDELLKEYYNLAVENYNEVFDLYPGEKEVNEPNFDPYAVEALEKAAELSRELGLKTKQIEYLEMLIENYPDSKAAIDAQKKLNEVYQGTFSKESQAVIYINNEIHFISLKGVEKPSYEDWGAELLITDDGEIKTFYLRKDDLERTSNSRLGIVVEEIKEDSVEIRYFHEDKWYDVVINPVDYHLGKKAEIEMGKTSQLTPKVSVKLVKTNLNKQAKVRIIPKTFGMRTESDFSFKIGIEKRAIKLSPEKTQEMIDNLGKSIEDWESVNSKLEKVVMGMKGACFATSAMLVVKNLFAGWSGESMARNEVMTSAGGWNEKCRLAFANQEDICGKGIPSSISDCLLDCNSEIEAMVDKLAGIYDEENKQMKIIQDKYKTEKSDILDFTGGTDFNKVKQDYCENVFSNLKLEGNIDLKGKGSVPLVGENGIYSQTQINECDIDLEEMKLLRLRELVKDDARLSEIINKKLGSDLVYTYDVNELNRVENILEQDAPGIPSFRGDTKLNYQPMTDVSKISDDNLKALFTSDVKKVMRDRIDGLSVVVGLVPVGGGKYTAEEVFTSRGGEFHWVKRNEDGKDIEYNIKEYYKSKGISQFTEANPGLYKNSMKGEIKVKYYERAPYKGLPALVPFDRENGWYVGTDYVLSGFGKPYQDSGRAMNFWICNVGSNRLIEFKQGDDCRYYNLGSSADLDFPGLDKSKSVRLVRDAERAINEAARQHGKKKVSVLGQVFETDIAENGESGRCTDFMSPQDCNLMFNICDPVMCPESRCDFGGEYRVSNVVQSGIIGSLLLCSRNFPEVKIPICLSGVHAGIEGYLSILKSTQACLQENLETGRNIGICDEIKSVYMCEFFWRQAVPLMDVFIPRLFGGLSGQGVRGGGEYLTINYAWENAKNSIDYFKNEYAVNAMKSFNARSTGEIGGEVCKMFVSARYPNSKEFFEKLVEPDVPVQYHAWFSEDILTEATIPSTSHYKVYYHIYAGEDIGANYVIYLRNPPESSYIHTFGRYVVDRGYIQRGQQVDEARDFTGVSGYQELCVNVNGQEECGFKQVSTSWAINELSRRYVEEQVTEEDITTSKECVSGSPSLWSFAQPNLQAGAQEALNPELYKRGIIRVCSSGNPGAQVEPSGELDKTKSTYDRWKKVGECDESAGIGCWIDTNSVENVLRDAPGLTDKVLDEIDVSYLGDVEIMPPEQIGPIFKEADGFELGLATNQLTRDNINTKVNSIVSSLIKITESGGLNTDKARAFLLVGKIYDLVTREIYSKTIKRTTDDFRESDEINQDEEDNFDIGTKVRDFSGEIWEKIDEDLWRGELSQDERSLEEIHDRPLYLVEDIGVGKAEIIKVEHMIKDDWIGDDEFYVDITFDNKGEEGYFMLRLYNAVNEKVDERARILVGKDKEKTIRLDTVGFRYGISNIGDYYGVALYKKISTAKYERIHYVKKDIGEGRKELEAEEDVQASIKIMIEERVGVVLDISLKEGIVITGISEGSTKCNYWYGERGWGNNAARSCVELNKENYFEGIIKIAQSHSEMIVNGNEIDVASSFERAIEVINILKIMKNGVIGETFRWTDDMLRGEIKIEIFVDDITKWNTMGEAYKYFPSRDVWASSDDSFNNALGYVEGINEIVKKVDFFLDKIFIEDSEIDRKVGDSDKEMAEKVFEVLRKWTDWTDEMLREKVAIKIDLDEPGHSITTYYEYDLSKGGWWSVDHSYDKLGYVAGIEEMVKKIDSSLDYFSIEGKKIVRERGDSDKEMADKVFELLKK